MISVKGYSLKKLAVARWYIYIPEVQIYFWKALE
jgi:hypothetical protein